MKHWLSQLCGRDLLDTMRTVRGGLMFDLNCDLGEDEPPDLTRRLMSLVSSANICCGVHAGSPAKTAAAIALALEYGVNAGAHPGAPGAFGRTGAEVTPRDLSDLVFSQTAGFAEACARIGGRVSHVKLHGALYHLAEGSPGHRQAFADTARELRERHGIRRVFVKAGGSLARMLEEEGAEVFGEVFLDRGYLPDGTLVPRGRPGDVIGAPSAAARIRTMAEEGVVHAIDGTPLRLRADTLCVHGDNPCATGILEEARRVLEGLRMS